MVFMVSLQPRLALPGPTTLSSSAGVTEKSGQTRVDGCRVPMGVGFAAAYGGDERWHEVFMRGDVIDFGTRLEISGQRIAHGTR